MFSYTTDLNTDRSEKQDLPAMTTINFKGR